MMHLRVMKLKCPALNVGRNYSPRIPSDDFFFPLLDGNLEPKAKGNQSFWKYKFKKSYFYYIYFKVTEFETDFFYVYIKNKSLSKDHCANSSVQKSYCSGKVNCEVLSITEHQGQRLYVLFRAYVNARVNNNIIIIIMNSWFEHAYS